MRSSIQWEKMECKIYLINHYNRYDMYYYDEKMAGQMDGGQLVDDEEFDSDDALFFDNNDLANRIWEDGD